MRHEFLECGQIMRAHGISGAMVVNHFCDSYEVFASLDAVYLKNGSSYTPHKVERVAPYKTNALLTIDGVSSPEAVTAMRLSYIYARREDILKGEDDYFIVDLIGLDVVDDDTSEKYGTLDDVINQGAQDIYVVKREGKPNAYIPCVPAFIKEIKLDEAIYITPIEGMLD